MWNKLDKYKYHRLFKTSIIFFFIFSNLWHIWANSNGNMRQCYF